MEDKMVSILGTEEAVAEESRVAAAEQCRARIEAAVKKIENSFYELARALYEAKKNDYFSLWGKSVAEYADELGIGRRKAFYLIRVGELIETLDIPKDRALAIGWMKLAMIGSLSGKNISPDDADKLLQLAEEMSFRGLKTYVTDMSEADSNENEANDSSSEEETKVLGPRSAVEFRVVIRHVFKGEEANIVNNALKAAMEEIDTDNEHDALLHICSQWILLRSSLDTPIGLDAWEEYLSKIYGGVSIVSTVSTDMTTSRIDEVKDIEKMVDRAITKIEREDDNVFHGDESEDSDQDLSDVDDDIDIDLRGLRL